VLKWVSCCHLGGDGAVHVDVSSIGWPVVRHPLRPLIELKVRGIGTGPRQVLINLLLDLRRRHRRSRSLASRVVADGTRVDRTRFVVLSGCPYSDRGWMDRPRLARERVVVAVSGLSGFDNGTGGGIPGMSSHLGRDPFGDEGSVSRT